MAGVFAESVHLMLAVLWTWQWKAVGGSLDFKYFLLIPGLDYPV